MEAVHCGRASPPRQGYRDVFLRWKLLGRLRIIIAGILSLAVQGIQGIQAIHNFCQNCTDEAAQQLQHELTVSAGNLWMPKSSVTGPNDTPAAPEARSASFRQGVGRGLH